MRVRCIGTTGRELLARLGITVPVEYPRPETVFGLLEVDQQYTVYGMWLSQGRMNYLCRPEPNVVRLYPSALFEVIDRTLPPFWHFSVKHSEDGGDAASWGYHEFVADPEHYERLFDYDEGAHRCFNRHMKQMDDWLESLPLL